MYVGDSVRKYMGNKTHVIRTKKEKVEREVRKRQRRFFHPNSVAAVTALPACATSVWGGQVSAWQAVSGLVSLQEECRSGAKAPGLQPALPAERPALPPHFTRFSLGASQGAAGAWGFQLQSCTLQTPGKWGRWPQLALTVNQPGRGEERGVTEARRREERKGRADSERRRRMTRG